MDTIETMLGTHKFEVKDFDSNYSDVVDSLSDTPYDSINSLNSDLTILQGLEELKNSELRLAVLDRYRTPGKTTYDIINKTYPGYLLALNDSGVSNQDFNLFCHVMDSCMISYGALNTADPFFTDSVDSRMYRAIYYILNTKKSASVSSNLSMKNASLFFKKDDLKGIMNEVKSMLKPLDLESSPSQVGKVVVSIMLLQLSEGNIIGRAEREAWYLKKGVIRVPTAATELSDITSATSVNLQGYVLEDGGAAVASRGITWATFYNPTTRDHSVTKGSGTGDFIVTINGLTEGTTYYARTWATNSTGTAYGNCISFVASSTVSIHDINSFARDFTIYPNPVSTSATLRFRLAISENLVINILDLNGREILHITPNLLTEGENQIKLNLSGIQNGIYICRITNGAEKVTCKLIVAH
jgi:hypothetical protein